MKDDDLGCEIDCDNPLMEVADSVFVDQPNEHMRFRDHGGWSEILVPGEFTRSEHREDVCGVVLTLAKLRGSKHVYIRILHPILNEQPRCARVESGFEKFIEFETFGFEDLTLSDYISFDESGTWGVYSYGNEFGYTAVGGRDGFVREVVAALGGLDKLKSDFERYQGVDERILQAARASCKWPV